ncbi:MAG: carbohydrate kinase family protein [Anaerolineaceae bacterium]|nr:carbohydrate kinase family protein [Anaerolineaceae bacterium]
MSRFFIAGLINLETTLAIDSFPLPYFPVRYPFFGIQTTVSGVGYNLAKALSTLGNQVNFASLIGTDDNGDLVRKALKADRIADDLILSEIDETAQSVIIYDPQGKRQIHTDLKDIQEQTYPLDRALETLGQADLAVICNINFARPLLQAAKDAGKWVATDVHALSSLDDAYNQDYLNAADILFLSDEALPDSPERVVRRIFDRFSAKIVVVGLGAEGALMGVRRDGFVGRFPAVKTREVINTIGAGDALFSAFLDRFLRSKDPYQAIRQANIFASYKIGEKGAAQGFLTGDELDAWQNH